MFEYNAIALIRGSGVRNIIENNEVNKDYYQQPIGAWHLSMRRVRTLSRILVDLRLQIRGSNNKRNEWYAFIHSETNVA